MKNKNEQRQIENLIKQPAMLAGLKKLESILPDTGIGLQIIGYDDQTATMANSRLRAESAGSDCLSNAETIIFLEGGEEYKSVRLFVKRPPAGLSDATRSELLYAAIELVTFIECRRELAVAA